MHNTGRVASSILSKKVCMWIILKVECIMCILEQHTQGLNIQLGKCRHTKQTIAL